MEQQSKLMYILKDHCTNEITQFCKKNWFMRRMHFKKTPTIFYKSLIWKVFFSIYSMIIKRKSVEAVIIVRSIWPEFFPIKLSQLFKTSKLDLQIRALNIQNALFPTNIQYYLQYKWWIWIFLIWLSCNIKINLKQFSLWAVMS